MKRIFLLATFILMGLAVVGQNAGLALSGVVREYDLNLSKKGLDGVQVQVTVGGVMRTDVSQNGGLFEISNLVNCHAGDPVITDASSFVKSGYELFYPDALNFWRVPSSTSAEPIEILMCKSSRINEVRQKLFRVVDNHHKELYEKKVAELQQLNLEKSVLDKQIVLLESQLRDTLQMMKIVNEWLYLDRLKCDSVLAKAYSFFENGDVDKALEIMNQHQMKSSDYYAKRRKDAVSEEAQARLFVKKRLMMNFDSKKKETIPVILSDCDFLIDSYNDQLQLDAAECIIDKNQINKYLAEVYAMKGDISYLTSDTTLLPVIIENYHKAAVMGNAHAQFQMGSLYEDALNNFYASTSRHRTRQMFNLDSARYWYQLAAEQNEANAINRLELFYDFKTKDKNGNDIFFHKLPDGKSVQVVDNNIYDVPDGLLFRSHDKHCYKGHIILPKKVTNKHTNYNVSEIEAFTFALCEELISIVIPNSVKSIGSGAFAACKTLKEVKLPSSLNKIEDHVFIYCPELQRIELPGTITEIGMEAFSCCGKLTRITIPPSVKHIGKNILDGGCRFLIVRQLSANPEHCSIDENKWMVDYMLAVPKGCVGKYREAAGWCNIPIITDDGELVKKRLKAIALYEEIDTLQEDSSNVELCCSKLKQAAALDSCFAYDCAKFLSEYGKADEASKYYSMALSYYENLKKNLSDPSFIEKFIDVVRKETAGVGKE